MANGYRKRSSTSATGVKRTTTQKQGGGVKTTTSHSTGTRSRVAFTRNSNGSLVQTTTRKTGDGYVVRQSKTLVPKYKPVKHPKPPKMPKLKTSVIKEAKPTKIKVPKYRPPKQKVATFKWPTAKKSSPRVRTSRSTNNDSGSFFTWVVVFAIVYMIFAVLSN